MVRSRDRLLGFGVAVVEGGPSPGSDRPQYLFGTIFWALGTSVPLWLAIVAGVVNDSVPRGHAPSSIAALGGPVSNALIRATRLHRLRARQLLQGIGLHPGHELLLMRLWDSGPQRQADLAAEFDTDSASMTRTVQR